MMTLPQINLYSHGTQWTVSHGHFAFWGAYGCGVIAIVYLVLQHARNATAFGSRAWKWSFALLNLGMLGMVLSTAVLLGVFVAAGGAYGILYGAALLRSSPLLARAARACYALQLLIALAVCLGAPLGMPWKLFVAASAVAYGFIPPLIWRLLELMHRDAGKEPRLS